MHTFIVSEKERNSGKWSYQNYQTNEKEREKKSWARQNNGWCLFRMVHSSYILKLRCDFMYSELLTLCIS